MAHQGRATLSIGAACLALLLLSVFARPSDAQDLGGSGPSSDDPSPTMPPNPFVPSSTTTAPSSSSTTTSTTTTTTAPPQPSTTATTTTTTTTTGASSTTESSTPPGAGEPPGTAPADDPGGDGGAAPQGPIAVPPDARRIIDAVLRTPANSSRELYDAVGELVDLGLSQEEAIRLGFGRFPVAGVADYSHDWLFPRFGPGFRFHHGTDVFAPFGTPLRAVADGTATAKSSSLGGLTVKVFTDDGTYFYYAHLSGLVDGFVDGMEVRTGDIIGYIGDSGNAKGGSPHLHFGVYPRGGEATDPKPLLDQFLADATEALPGLVEQVKATRTAATAGGPAQPRTPRSLLATSLLRPLTERTASADVPTEILYQATGNPSAGGASIVKAEAEHLAGRIDWEAWQRRSDVGR